ncbi:MAG: acetylglutamate kinase [Verrucomicrobia bacterium]|nr:acetylglutamate kinase [Verrucomicrobiota bacterium]
MVEQAISKAATLIEALPYIQRFRHKIVVVKFGGSAMEVQAHADSILTDMTLMECVGMRPVIVHGGGKAISRRMEEAGIESAFNQGLRVTCDRSIDVVDRVMSEEVNPGIVASLVSRGALAAGLHGRDVFRVQRKQGIDPDTGAPLDWGFVGDPSEVNTAPIRALIEKGILPVISPLGIGEDGKLHNINADNAAAAVAKALQASKLVFLTDVPGLLRESQNEASIISTLRTSEIAGLIRDRVIDGGMLPKVQSSMNALAAGVGKVHMIDGRMPHSLLLEIFTNTGVGTEIIHDE